MEKLKLVSPASLKGDDGWKLRDLYSELIIDIDKYALYIDCEFLYWMRQKELILRIDESSITM